ncbi:hypothetical protein [Streptomyces sp. NBC_00342]|uniref:hypothetical protein n=1 Tax=Streptomyces sp. NBC_00342 TaxID=2975718 RepID=UPI002E2A4DD1|nr:hypothetical protein [Streptomyces sp. NBC_00342]
MTSTQARHTRRAVLQAAVDADGHCHGSGQEHLSVSTLAPQAGAIDDIRREDDRKGYERDETDQFHQVVRGLVDDGDRRAYAAGHQARRTFAEMAPGQTRQPVLRMARQLSFTPTAPAGLVAGGQCSSCQGAGGKMIDTSSDGVTRQTWQSCTACGGTGATR